MARLETLHERMRAVYIGRRFMGEIPEAEWNTIVAYVSTNGAIWEAQVKNLFRVAARLLGFGFISLPIGVFWTAAMLGWLGKPITIGGIEGHVGGLLNQPAILAAAVAMGVGSMLAIGLKLGYVNYFAKARSALLKERLDVTEPGECSIR
jgi:hypothetical protein